MPVIPIVKWEICSHARLGHATIPGKTDRERRGVQHCAHACALGGSQLPAACLHPVVTVPLVTVGCCCYHLE